MATSHRPPLDYAGAAEYLNTTKRHVQGLVRAGKLPYTKLGHLVRLRPDDLDEWLVANTRRVAS